MREHRFPGRRRLTARLPVLLLALAAALSGLLLGSVGVGQAQTAASLIEVQGGGTPDRLRVASGRLGIETAASAGAAYDGWVVTEVELRIRPDDGTGTIRTATPPGLAICESDADGNPLETCYPLTAPSAVEIPAGMTGQEVTYTAPGSGHFLTAGVNYTLHFTENGSTNAGDVHFLDASNNDGEVTSVAGMFRHAMRKLEVRRYVGPQYHEHRLGTHHRLCQHHPRGGPGPHQQHRAVAGAWGSIRRRVRQGRRPGVHDRDGPRRLHADRHPTQARNRHHHRDDSPNREAAPRFPHRRGGGRIQRPAFPGRGPQDEASTRSRRPPPSPSARPPSTFWSPRAVGRTGHPPSPSPPTAHPGMAGRSMLSSMTRPHDSTGDFSQAAATGALKVGVHGTVNPRPPLISNVGRGPGPTQVNLNASDVAQGS